MVHNKYNYNNYNKILHWIYNNTPNAIQDLTNHTTGIFERSFNTVHNKNNFVVLLDILFNKNTKY